MVDHEVTRLFNELYETALHERRIALRRSIERSMSELALRGLATSGAAVQQSVELMRGELRVRGVLAWDKLQEILSDLGFDPQVQSSRDVKELLAVTLDSQCAELSGQLSKQIQLINLQPQVSELAGDLSNIKRELNARVDLLTARLARHRPEGSSGQVFNFHAPVGAVQTGSHAVVKLTLNLTPVGIEQLKQAMADVRSAAAAAPELSPGSRTEIVEIAHNVTRELSAEHPNKLRIANLATGIATTIQTVGSLQSAYAALKIAMSFVGLQLP